MSLLSEYKSRVKYLESLILYQFSFPLSTQNKRSRLGDYLKQLKELEDIPVVDTFDYLFLIIQNSHKKKIAEFLIAQIFEIVQPNKSLETFRDEYKSYHKLLSVQKSTDVKISTLSFENQSFWGTRAQLLTAKCTIDGINKSLAYNLHSVWGALLNPTGGIVGPGNLKLFHSPNSPIELHSCVHDASGYLYNTHDIGNGYNYLKHEKPKSKKKWCCCGTLIPTKSPISGQLNGIKFWENVQTRFKENGITFYGV